MKVTTSAANPENKIERNIFIGRQPILTSYMDGKMDVMCPKICRWKNETERWMGRRKVRCTDETLGWTNGWTETRRMDEWMNGWMAIHRQRMGEPVNEWVETMRSVDGWMDGWMDGWRQWDW